MFLKKIAHLCFILIIVSLLTTQRSFAQKSDVLTIAFGSCNKHDLPQPLWSPILAENPEVFMWLGDNVYGDTPDMALLKRKYDSQLMHPDYRKVREKTKVIGIWDDHDYGINDGGKYFAQKETSMQLMLDFLEEPKDSPRRKQQGGAYAAHEFGEGESKVKVILLDTRFNRDTLMVVDKVYQPNLTGSLLGEEQWIWLEKELKNSTAKVHLIASGIQMIPTEHPYEKWENFPLEREKLLRLLSQNNVKNPVLISGDRHIAEISKWQSKDFPEGLYEVTSSGMTHVWKTFREEYNPYRVGNLIASLHYGLARIDWSRKEMTFQIKGEKGQVYLEQKLSIH